MRKKIIVLYMAVLLALIWIVPAFAADSNENISEIVSVYCSEDTLHTFIRFQEDCDSEQLSGTLMLNDILVAEDTLAAPLKSSLAKTHYVLLIDRSTSMQEHAEEISNFTDKLAETLGSEALYSILTFGDQFEAAAENLSDVNEMQTAVHNLQYTGTLSNPYDGVEQAIQYLDGHSRQAGELVNLILMTDGSIYLGDIWEGERQALEEQEAKSTSELITSTPEVILHTLHIGEWDALADQTFSNGTGLQLSLSGKDASDPARELVGFTDGLYRMDFPFHPVDKEKKLDLKLQLNGRLNGELLFQEYELKSVPVLQTAISPQSEERTGTPSQSEPGGNGEEEKPSAGETEEEEPSEEKTEADKTKEEKPDEEKSEEGSREDKQEELKDKEETGYVQADSQSGICTGQWVLIVSVLGIIIIILVIVIVAILQKQRNVSKMQNESGHEGKIYMRLDVISGELFNAGREFYLQDQIIIGRSRKCDIIWKDKCVSEKNTRIYMENEKIYIEDLNSMEGTALGGMRLHSPNILRSGEQISIGKVCFVLRF